MQFLLGFSQRISHQAPISLVFSRFFDDVLGLEIKTVLKSNFGSFWCLCGSNFGSFWWLSGPIPLKEFCTRPLYRWCFLRFFRRFFEVGDQDGVEIEFWVILVPLWVEFWVILVPLWIYQQKNGSPSQALETDAKQLGCGRPPDAKRGELHQHRPQVATNHVSTIFMHNKEFIGRPIPDKRNEIKAAAEPEPGTRRSQKITMEQSSS